MHAVAENAIHGVFGDAFRHVPMARPADVSAKHVEDTSRQFQQILGIFHSAPTDPMLAHSYDTHMSQRPGVSAPIMTITLKTGTVIDLRESDHLVRIEDSATFRVVNTFTSETGAIVAQVNKVG